MKPVTFSNFAPMEQTSADMLAIGRNLARLYSDVLEQALPDDLRELLLRLGQRAPTGSTAEGDGRKVFDAPS
jgi:hypothetical protein